MSIEVGKLVRYRVFGSEKWIESVIAEVMMTSSGETLVRTCHGHVAGAASFVVASTSEASGLDSVSGPNVLALAQSGGGKTKTEGKTHEEE